MEIANLDAQARAYFDSLPATVQESIMQSNISLNSKEELVTFSENLLRSGNTGAESGR